MFSVQSFTALRMLRPNSLQVEQCILQAGRNTLQNWGPIICTCCQELCFVWFLLKEGKDVMRSVYDLETFPVSLALWLVFYRDAVTVQVLNQIFHTMKNWFHCPVSFQEKHFVITIRYFSLINQCFYLFSVNTTKGSLFSPFQYEKEFCEQRRNCCSSWAI